MEPLNFEDNIRQKLQEREITPSKNAWSKLSDKLDAQPKNKKPMFFWYAIAATLVTMLVVASLVFNENSVNPNKNPIVVVNPTKKENNKKNNKENNNKIDVKKEIQLKEEKVPSNIKLSQTSKNTTKKKHGLNKKETHFNTAKKQETTHLATVIIPNEEQKDSKKQLVAITTTKKDNVINKKVNQVVTQIEALKAKNKNVTMAEIDSLLKNAQREIQLQKIIKSKKIDANQLLADVEFDMYNSFKDKVFLALGEGFEYVKGAVSNKNN